MSVRENQKRMHRLNCKQQFSRQVTNAFCVSVITARAVQAMYRWLMHHGMGLC